MEEENVMLLEGEGDATKVKRILAKKQKEPETARVTQRN